MSASVAMTQDLSGRNSKYDSALTFIVATLPRLNLFSPKNSFILGSLLVQNPHFCNCFMQGSLRAEYPQILNLLFGQLLSKTSSSVPHFEPVMLDRV